MPLTQAVTDIIAKHPSLSLIGNTPLVRIDLFQDELPDVEIWAKMEAFNPGGSLKDRPVLRMLSEAVADGRLEPGMTILDSSSGNAGIAYAMIGAVLGQPVKIVIPNNASMERKKRLRRMALTHTLRMPSRATMKHSVKYDASMSRIQRATFSAISTATTITGWPITTGPQTKFGTRLATK